MTKQIHNRKAKILESALCLFSEKGFAHVSMNQVAQHAGVTKSLIFHHFDSKNQLWDDVKNHLFQRYVDGQLDLFESEKDPIELIKKSIQAYFTFLKKNPQIAKIFAWAHLENDETCGQLDAPLVFGGSQLIKEAQQNGKLRKDIDPIAIIMTFVSVINQYYVAQCHFEVWNEKFYSEPDMFIQSLTDIIIKGVTP